MNKGEAQEIIFTRRIEPPGEQPLGRRIPVAHVPKAIQNIGRRGDGIDTSCERGGDISALGFTLFRIALAGEVEKIGALGAIKSQRRRQPPQRAHRDRNIAALFDPGVPCRAEPAELGHLFAPQPRRAAPLAGRQANRGGRYAFALRPDEIAKSAPLFCRLCFSHGAFYTSITGQLNPVF